MTTTRVLHLYLTEYVLWQHRRGKYPFLARLSQVFAERGWSIALHDDALAERLLAASRPGRHLFFEHAPVGPETLTMRRVYWDPFWRIEASAERWAWPVARARFDPDDVDPDRADQFVGFWHPRLGLDRVARDDFIYVPMQGKWSAKRSFQSMSPVKMVKTLLDRFDLPLVLTCHPGEDLGQDETRFLARWADHPRITISGAPMTDLLPRARLVATQNSSVALKGMFCGTPALLFAQVDFHHLTASVPRDGLDAAIDNALAKKDYSRYLFWFFQIQSLNHWRAEFPDRLAAWLTDRGWDV